MTRFGGAMLALTLCALPACGGSSDEAATAADAGTEDVDSGGSFLDPTCTLTGDLQVTVGDGESPAVFQPLTDGHEPTLNHGPQGGQHLFLGVQVANPAADYPKLQLDLVAESGEGACDVEKGECDSWNEVGHAKAVVKPGDPLMETEADGSVVASGLIVIVSQWPVGQMRRIRGSALDPCGRTGESIVILAPQPETP